jgi:hypothetical protein
VERRLEGDNEALDEAPNEYESGEAVPWPDMNFYPREGARSRFDIPAPGEKIEVVL